MRPAGRGLALPHYMYYDINTTLSHNAFINMVVSGRGRGKTYAAKEKAVRNYLSGRGKFLYVRRYDDELKMVQKGLFNDFNLNHVQQVTYDKNLFWIDRDMDIGEQGEVIGYGVSLSTSHKLKSASFPDVSLIIFDEFIIDTESNVRYLKNEVRKFLDLIETVGRMRDNLKVVMLANSLSIVTPYTAYWDIFPEGEFTKVKDGLVLLHIVPDDPEFIAAKNQTQFGRLIQGEEYAEMSVHNKFILDSNEFICARPSRARYLMTLDYEGVSYGIWKDIQGDKVYVDTKVDPSASLRYAITLKDHTTDKTLLDGSCYMIEYVLKYFQRGQIGFDTIQTKGALLKILKLSTKFKG